MPRAIAGVDRAAIFSLAVADAGVGVFLIAVGSLPGFPVVHTVVGVLALLLATPAFAAAFTGRLPALADEGVLVNVAVMVFVTFEVFFLPAQLGQRLGLAILVLAATIGTVGLYLRLFGVLRMPQVRGRHQ